MSKKQGTKGGSVCNKTYSLNVLCYVLCVMLKTSRNALIVLSIFRFEKVSTLSRVTLRLEMSNVAFLN